MHNLCGRYKGNHLKELVEFLLTNGIEVNALTNEGYTALHLLCFKYSGADLKEIIEILIKNGAEMDRLFEDSTDSLYFVLKNNYNRSDLPDIVDLFYANRGVRRYNPLALIAACFFYRGPDLINIIKRIVEGAPSLEKFDQSQFVECMGMASKVLREFNQDLNRQEEKDFLFDAICKLHKNHVDDDEIRVIADDDLDILAERYVQVPNPITE